ncbi:hypothetical protein BG006_003745, partial [Podila minutissima]
TQDPHQHLTARAPHDLYQAFHASFFDYAMQLSYLLSSLLLAVAASATDFDYQQRCYEICVHKDCGISDTTNACQSSFVSTRTGIVNRYSFKDVRHISICLMAPQGTPIFDRASYDCQT